MAAPVALAYSGLVYPTILAVRAQGGTADISEIERYVASALSLNSDILAHRRTNARDARSEYQYRLAWVRTYLKNDGALINTANSQWSLTRYGDAMTEKEARDVFRRVRNKQKEKRAAKGPSADNAHLAPFGINPDQYPPPDKQRPATFRFKLEDGKLHAESINASFDLTDASAILRHLVGSAEQLSNETQGANSPITRLIGDRARELIFVLDRDSANLVAGDLVALWSTFESFVRLLNTPEGEQETSLSVRHLTWEVLQRLTTLASLSNNVREIVAYRNAISFDLKSGENFDRLQRSLTQIASSHAFESIVDPSVIDALNAHEARKQDVLETASRTQDIDAIAKANLDASDIRKLQALDAANLASSLIEGVSSSTPPRGAAKGAWKRFNERLKERFPEEMADAVIETAANIVRSVPNLAFAVFGAMLLPTFGLLAGLVPSLFSGPAKILKNRLPKYAS